MRLVPLFLVAVVGCSGGGGSSTPDARDDGPVPDATAAIPDAPVDAPGSDTASGCADLTASGAVDLPRNIIVVLGDGMGRKHVEAGRIANGAALAFEELATPVLLQTDSLDWDAHGEPTDSAAAATAIATGQQVHNGSVSHRDDTALQTIAEVAQSRGKAIGLVTTSASFDASTAALGAHVPDRDMSTEIATQLLRTFQPDVLLGGGAAQFDADDGALLTLAGDEGYFVVRDAAGLDAWDPGAEPRILGVFESSVTAPSPFEELFPFHMTPFARRDESSTDPVLPDMVDRALERLESDPEGFFLFVENEQIDTISHQAVVDLENARTDIPIEVAQLDAALTNITAWVEANSSWSETLVLVGSDHETGGYDFTGTDLSGATFDNSPYHTRVTVPWYIKGAGADDLTALCGLPDLYLLMSGQL